MDTKEALKILDLKSGVSLEEAKTAYRALAKQYHPDIVGESSQLQIDSEAKMKDINLAFRCVAPGLKTQKEIDALKPNQEKKETGKKKAQTAKPKEHKTSKAQKKSDFSWFALFEDFGLFLKKKRAPKSRKKDSDTKRKAFNKKSTGNNLNNFEEIFNQIHPDGGLKNRKKRPRPKKRTPNTSKAYSNYQRYMDLKRKMKKNKTRRAPDMSVGRVQRIQPVKPVERVKK